MADFFLDNNVAVDLAVRLRHLGHTAVTARDHGTPHANDNEHLLTAALNGWILVTHDRKDFIELHRAWCNWLRQFGVSVTHSGILVIPQVPPPQRDRLAREIDTLVRRQAVLENTLHTWSPAGGWRRIQE